MRSFGTYNAYGDGPLIVFPPLFSVVLVGLTLFGLDVSRAARGFEAACFGAIVSLSGYWFVRQVKPRLLAIGGVIGVLVSQPLNYVTSYALSEPLFILLTLCFLLAIHTFLETDQRAWLLGAAAVAALASLARYSGATVIVTGVVVLLLLPKTSLRVRMANATVFGVVASLPPLLWLARNLIRSSTLTGERGVSPYTLSDNVQSALGIAGYRLFPIGGTPVLAHCAVVPLLLIGACCVALIPRDRDRDRDLAQKAIVPAACFVAIYMAFIVVSATTVAFNHIDVRLMAPMQIPLIYLAVQIASAGRLLQSRRARLSSAAIAATIVLVALVSNTFSTLTYTQQVVAYGAGGFASEKFQSSAVIAAARALPRSARLYTNMPHAVYLLAERKATEIPRKYIYNSPETTTTESSAQFIREFNPSVESYLVWFEKDPVADTSYLYSLDEMMRIADLTLVTRTPDGSLYRLAPKNRQ